MRWSLALRAAAAIVLAVVVAGVVGSTSSRAQGNPEAGWQLARKRCTGCHIIDLAGNGADVAPAFPKTARERRGDQRWLRSWLEMPHPSMPSQNLSRGEVDDIVVYLQSLVRP